MMKSTLQALANYLEQFDAECYFDEDSSKPSILDVQPINVGILYESSEKKFKVIAPYGGGKQSVLLDSPLQVLNYIILRKYED